MRDKTAFRINIEISSLVNKRFRYLHMRYELIGISRLATKICIYIYLRIFTVSDFVCPKYEINEFYRRIFILQMARRRPAFCLRIFYLWRFQSEE